MFDWLKGLSDTGTFVRAYLTLLVERGPMVLLGVLLVIIGVVLFVVGNKQVQGAVSGVVSTVATRGGNIASKVTGK